VLVCDLHGLGDTGFVCEEMRLRGANVEQDGVGRGQFRGPSHLLVDDLRFLVEEGCGEFGSHVRRGLDVVDPVSHFMTDVVSPSLQGFQLLLGGVGHGRESLAHGVDNAGMSTGRFRTSKCGETAHPSSIGTQLRVLKGFALHELWLEQVDGVWEPQGPERRRFLPALQHAQAGLDLAMRLRGGPLCLAL
jgi:hypothetical protein